MTRTRWIAKTELAKAVELAGFTYDPEQQIIYSTMDPLQRYFGYCQLYDQVSPLAISAIIDCEPVYFDYDGQCWLLEFWKGQYCIETGAEIGVYNIETKKSEKVLKLLKLILPDEYEYIIEGEGHNHAHAFYPCANSAELLELSFTLMRNGAVLFTRNEEPHWWLTGFRWGEISECADLTMEASIGFPNPEMCEACAGAMKALGYDNIENISDNKIRFIFDRPKNPQPYLKEKIKTKVSASNKILVDLYKEMKIECGITSNDPNLIQKQMMKSKKAKQVYKAIIGFYRQLSELNSQLAQ